MSEVKLGEDPTHSLGSQRRAQMVLTSCPKPKTLNPERYVIHNLGYQAVVGSMSAARSLLKSTRVLLKDLSGFWKGCGFSYLEC